MEKEQVKYYYLRDKGYTNKPAITVCLLKNSEGIISSGIAICSDSDNPNKKVGRQLALKRARKASGVKSSHDISISQLFMKGKKNCLESMCYYGDLNGCGKYFNYLYEYNPELTDLEKRIWKI